MNFEVIFRLRGKELARYQFPVETPADFEAGASDMQLKRSASINLKSICLATACLC